MNDNIEVEYKFKIKNDKHLAEIVEKLDEMLSTNMTFSKKKRVYESNVMFDSPSQIMQQTDGRIRVRTIGEAGDKLLTYKKPLPPENGAKREIEHEIKFRDPSNQIENILSAMLFSPTTSYERYRTQWDLNNIHVTLDEYPFAMFVEIEGEQSLIETLADGLGFNVVDGLTKPADTLFQEWREESGLPFKPHMTFATYDK